MRVALVRVAVAGMLAAFFGVFFPALVHAQPPEGKRSRNVLFLNDGDPALPAFQAINRGFRTAREAEGARRYDLFYESLDLIRFPEAEYGKELVAMLARKYERIRIDVVVTVSTSSLTFADKHRSTLWPGAYIVFGGVPPEFVRSQPPRPYWVGLTDGYDIAGTADLAMRLRPSTRRIVAISGSSGYDRMIAGVAHAALEATAQRVQVEYWEELELSEVLARLARLKSDTAVIYLAIGRDPSGATFIPRDVLPRISAASPVPVYGPFETFIGYGIAAGSISSFEGTGRRLGELVEEVLALPPGAAPPPAKPARAVCMAQVEEMERRGLSVSLLPPDCILNYAQRSLWRDYRWHVLAALTIILAQAALIAALAWQRRARTLAEAETQRRRVELAQAGRLALAGELTASIAHEINQPLGSILVNAGAAEAILKRDPAANEELRTIVEDIRRADLRATEVIRRVRSLVTNRQAERESVDAEEMVRDVLAVLRGECERRGVAVQANLSPGLPPLFVDRVQAQQGLVNLCINAMEAMAERPAGERVLGVRTSRGEDGTVVISVSDTGPGISPEHLPSLFDSFFTTKAQGTGLGLSITRSIAEAHGGSIAAENRAGGGAVFRFTLPTGVAVTP